MQVRLLAYAKCRQKKKERKEKVWLGGFARGTHYTCCRHSVISCNTYVPIGRQSALRIVIGLKIFLIFYWKSFKLQIRLIWFYPLGDSARDYNSPEFYLALYGITRKLSS